MGHALLEADDELEDDAIAAREQRLRDMREQQAARDAREARLRALEADLDDCALEADLDPHGPWRLCCLCWRPVGDDIESHGSAVVDCMQCYWPIHWDCCKHNETNKCGWRNRPEKSDDGSWTWPAKSDGRDWPENSDDNGGGWMWPEKRDENCSWWNWPAQSDDGRWAWPGKSDGWDWPRRGDDDSGGWAWPKKKQTLGWKRAPKARASTRWRHLGAWGRGGGTQGGSGEIRVEAA